MSCFGNMGAAERWRTAPVQDDRSYRVRVTSRRPDGTWDQHTEVYMDDGSGVFRLQPHSLDEADRP